MKQEKTTTPEQKQSASMAAAGAAVFFSSACLMILEIAAGRLTAGVLGTSIYTWTAVIGVVLAGVTAGNYLGGRIADRTAADSAVAGLFVVASITCVAAIILSNRIGDWSVLWQLSWPQYVLLCVAALFFPPSVCLAAINPVAAKAALDRGTATGRTIGQIYALGAAGSIVGTFLAGFYLISAIGTTGVIWATAASLVVAGLFYSPGCRLLNLWVAVLAALIALATASGKWAEQTGLLLAIRARPEPNLLYEDETQYSHVRIIRQSARPDRRIFLQDKLKHSEILMEDVANLQYPYEKIYAAVMEQTCGNSGTIAMLGIGGGGFVFPRYVKHRWPGSRVDVAEIDPGVIRAAMAAFGLPAHTDINIHTMDGRNFIDEMIARRQRGQEVPRYDFIYEDAFDNFSVPWQLLTKEFNDKVARLLADQGCYVINLIDIYRIGLMLDSVIKTLEQTFRHVYALTPEFEYYNRATFVLIASNRPLDTDSLMAQITRHYRTALCLSASDMLDLRRRSGGMVLTDDFAPVDNLAAPIARQGGPSTIAAVYISRAQLMSRNGQRPVDTYMKAIEVCPHLTVKSYYDISDDLLKHGEFEQAATVCRKALELYDRPEVSSDISLLDYSMGLALKGLGRQTEAREHLTRAINGFKAALQKDPNALDVLPRLGMALADSARMAEATACFEKAVKAYPAEPEYRLMLANALINQKRYAEAKKAITEAMEYMRRMGQHEAAQRFEQMLAKVTYNESIHN